MNTVKYSRLAAGITLVIAFVVCASYALINSGGTFSAKRGSTQESARGSDMEKFELAIARGNAAADTWFGYAEKLREQKRYRDAAEGYRQVLKTEPFHQEARFYAAISLAQAGEKDKLHDFMADLVLTDAKLAVEIFNRSEMSQYLASDDFRPLVQEAVNQAND